MRRIGSVHHHRVGYQPLGGGISLYRHGRDPRVALQQRDALQEVMLAACRHLLHGMEDARGVTAEIKIDRKEYVIALLPVKVKDKDGKLVKNDKLRGLRGA